jgi:hypothetical protein
LIQLLLLKSRRISPTKAELRKPDGSSKGEKQLKEQLNKLREKKQELLVRKKTDF